MTLAIISALIVIAIFWFVMWLGHGVHEGLF